jgi:hypothetical protein
MTKISKTSDRYYEKLRYSGETLLEAKQRVEKERERRLLKRKATGRLDL